MSLSVHIIKKLEKYTLQVDFEADNEVLALLGASGSGKSMTLKCIAGIETPDQGRIVLNKTVLFDSQQKINLPAQKRKVGYLFQQYALFPHMTVEQNIASGVRLSEKKKKHTQKEIVNQIIQTMELQGLEKKKPHQISGGEQQRTALARILVNEPEVLLLDEPFSALDSFLRFRLEPKVQEILDQFGKTILLVSHDKEEAFRLSNRIAVLSDGKIQTIGDKAEVFRNPRTTAAALLTGETNLSRARYVDQTHVYAEDWGITLTVPAASPKITQVGIRMKDIRTEGCEITDFSMSDESSSNTLSAAVIRTTEESTGYTLWVKSESTNLLGIKVDKASQDKLSCGKLLIFLPPEKILLLEE